MTKPLLLLDVDGVCLPFGGEFRTSAWHSRFDGHESNRIPDEIRHRLAKLMERLSVHWCTGWEYEANTVLGRQNKLPALPVVPLRNLNAFDVHWKLAAIVEYVGDEPFAFIDDDIGPEAIEWAEERNKTIPTLFVPVACATGLTDKHVDKLFAWADSVVADVMEPAA